MVLDEIKKRINNIKLMFISEWRPAHYLQDYYSTVQADEIETIKFLVDRFKELFKNKPRVPVLLEFGVGPTMHHIFAAVPYADEIHMADFLDINLKDIRKWLSRDKDAHNWDPFIEYTLKCEGINNPTVEDIESRKQETRKKITKLFIADASQENPGGKELSNHYPVVMSCYCADSATQNIDEWQKYMQNIVSMITQNGSFIVTALYKTKGYKVGDKIFPSAYISEKEMATTLALAFPTDKTTMDVRHLEGHESQGYHGVLFAAASNKYENQQIVSFT